MKRQKIPLAVAKRVRNEAQYRCGYCLTSEILIGMAMEFDHYYLIPGAEKQSKKIFGWLVVDAMNLKVHKLQLLI